MWLKINSLFVGIGLCLLVTSCYYDKEDELYGTNNCDTSLVSFSNDILPIINNSCATVGCHVQGGGGVGIFENHTQIKSKVDDGSFNQRVVVQQDMPPSSPLSDCQIAHIQQWIIEGAPNN